MGNLLEKVDKIFPQTKSIEKPSRLSLKLTDIEDFIFAPIAYLMIMLGIIEKK